MNKGLKTVLFALALVALASCGSDDAAEEGAGSIDTGDVKGEIDLMGTEGGKMNYNFNGKDSKAYQVEIGETAELMIFPDDRSFEEVKGEVDRRIKSSFYEVEVISEDKDFIFYKETKAPFGSENKDEEKTGYAFILVVKKDDKMNYILESNGENPLDPIWKKADAEKLLKIAQSFKPKS